MKINPEDIEVPLESEITVKDGEVELSIAKKYGDTEAGVYKSYMSHCTADDKCMIDTKGMDKDETMKCCSAQYGKMRAMMMDDSKGELSEDQKKLPPALQKAIIDKMKKEGKYKGEEKEEKED
jgi:hypothetical protein